MRMMGIIAVVAVIIALLGAVVIQRTRRLRASQQSEAHARLLLDSTFEAIFGLDLEGHVTFVNQACLALLGYASGEELIGRHASAVLGRGAGGGSDTVDGLLDALAEGKSFRTEEGLLRRADGASFPAQIWSKPMRRQGVLQGAVVGFLDASETEQAHRDREALIAALEARNTEMERFTYTVSHDLTSPLITIRGFLGMLEEDAAAGDAAEMKADIEHIRAATDGMHLLIEDLLELSRIGRVVNPPEEVSIAAIAREAVSRVAGDIEERGVRVHIARDLPIVVGDRARLVQVFQNVVENAVKYMGPQPAPEIRIGGEERDGEIRCHVGDNGIGIDPIHHEKIFEVFQRVETKVRGTGLGLALAKRIIETHGGQIWVESNGAGRGSTFYFTLPKIMTGCTPEEAHGSNHQSAAGR